MLVHASAMHGDGSRDCTRSVAQPFCSNSWQAWLRQRQPSPKWLPRVEVACCCMEMQAGSMRQPPSPER